MKNDGVIIYTNHNGYSVSPYDRNGSYASVLNSWSFETMSELQRRLPEILSAPVEQRTKECECKKND